MAIFANQSAIRFSSTPVDIIARKPIPNGSILVYNAEKGVFLTSNNSSLPSIQNGKNIGSENSFPIFKEKNGFDLVFKSIEAGNGIDIDSKDDSLVISASITNNRIVSQNDFNIVIDNDNNDTNSYLNLLTGTATPNNPIIIKPRNTILFDQTVLAGIDNNRSFVKSTGQNEFIETFFENQFLEIKNSEELNGDYFIDEINFKEGDDIIYFQNMFSNQSNFPAFFNNATFIAWDLYATSFTTIETSFTDFGPNGYDLKKGMKIQITGSENSEFNGSYTIDNVISLSSASGIKSVISLDENTPLSSTGFIKDSAPINSNLTISIINHVGSTGFSVDKFGDIRGTNLILSEDITSKNLILSKDLVSRNINNSNIINTKDLIISHETSTNVLSVGEKTTTKSLHAFEKISTDSVPISNNDVTTKKWVEDNTVEITNLNGAAVLPSGTTAQRPTEAINGMIRYNIETQKIEVCIGNLWINLN